MIAPPTITLTTDFGTAGGYAAAMKGRILSIAPDCRLVDISHEIAPHDIRQGAWCLRRAAPQFPAGTIHLAVVDPGVGSEREGIVVETEQGLLVGPDNGLLSLAAAEMGVVLAVNIAPSPGRWKRSASFDGLELFAPVAAYLATGLPLVEIGTQVKELARLDESSPRMEGDVLTGRIDLFDRFGNAITNIPRMDCHGREPLRVEWGAAQPVRVLKYYTEPGLAKGSLGAIWNSDGLLELALPSGSARERFGLTEGMPVRIVLADRDGLQPPQTRSAT